MNRDDVVEALALDHLRRYEMMTGTQAETHRAKDDRYWKAAKAFAGGTLAALSQSGLALVPVVAEHEALSAMACSTARDDEGTFGPLMDLIDFSGENALHTVLRQAYADAIRSANLLPQPAILKGGDDGG